MHESFADQEIVLSWWLEAHPEYLESIRYMQTEAGTDPVPVTLSPQALRAYALWRLAMALGDTSLSYYLLALGTTATYLEREAAGRLDVTSIWQEAHRIVPAAQWL